MTQEEKAKAYDEALEIAKKNYNNIQDLYGYPIGVECFKNTLESIFPELKESEDEKIKKEIIEYIKTGTYHKKWVAWLEKQGNKPQGKSALEAIREEKVDNANKIEPKDYSCIDPHFGKPIDKVEPKLKIEKDKWYVCIRDLDDNYGTKAFCKGSTYYSTKDETLIPGNSNIPYEIKYCVNDYFRPWTIQDAKDGDVLFHSDSASNGIFIFKEILQRETIQKVICYCDYDSEDGFCLGENHTCCWTDSKIIHPATKEQSDRLFTKMKEAGYKWDAEKKELIKEKVK